MSRFTLEEFLSLNKYGADVVVEDLNDDRIDIEKLWDEISDSEVIVVYPINGNTIGVEIDFNYKKYLQMKEWEAEEESEAED